MNTRTQAIIGAVVGLLVGAIFLLIPWNSETPPDTQPTTTVTDNTTSTTQLPATTIPGTTGSVIPTQPKPTETEPSSTGPAPTEPQIPTEPAPTEPTPTETEHAHSYTSQVTREATCSAEGEKTYSCTCGKAYTESIPKTDHNYDTVTIDQAPTCTEYGRQLHSCVCGDSYETAIEPLGHEWGDEVILREPTATEGGQMQHTCSVCGLTATEAIPATGDEIKGYIDARFQVEYVGRNEDPSYTCPGINMDVTNRCAFENYLTILINEDSSFSISYYLQDGTKVTYTLVPVPDYFVAFTILADGSYVTSINGDYSD